MALVEILLSREDLNLNLKTYEGYTALQLAMGRRLISVVQLLMMAGADEASLPSDSDSDEAEQVRGM